MKKNGRLCGCGRKGCLETYCSGPGLVRTYCEIVPGANTDETDAKMICTLALDGNKNALKALEKTGEMLGLALANSVVYTNPEKIFLFGGVTGAGQNLLDPTIKSFEENLLEIFKGKVTIRLSELKADEAAIVGAASLVLNF